MYFGCAMDLEAIKYGDIFHMEAPDTIKGLWGKKTRLSQLASQRVHGTALFLSLPLRCFLSLFTHVPILYT